MVGLNLYYDLKDQFSLPSYLPIWVFSNKIYFFLLFGVEIPEESWE